MTSTIKYLYDLDTSGVSPQNRIHDERHTLPTYIPSEWRYIVPRSAPFFTANYEVYLIDPATNAKTKLERYQHYAEGHPYAAVTNALQKQVCGSIIITDTTITGTVSIEYNTIGGPFTIDSAKILEILANRQVNPVTVDWSQVADVPAKFPPEIHYHPAENLGEYGQLVTAVKDNTEAMKNEYDINSVTLNRHLRDDNPHGITLEKLQVPHLRNTHMATDKEVEDASNLLALITAANLSHFARIYNLKKDGSNGGNGGGSGGGNNTNILDLQEELRKLKDSLNKVKNYGVAENDNQLIPDANQLYATVANIFRVIEKQYANMGEALNPNLWAKIITPAALHGVVNDYMQIGSMFFLPRTLVKSSRCVIPNGAKFNAAVYGDLYNYLGSDYLPPAHGTYIKTYSPGVDPENTVGYIYEGTNVLRDVSGNVTIGIDQNNLLVPHYHQTDYYGYQAADSRLHHNSLISTGSDRNNSMPIGNHILRGSSTNSSNINDGNNGTSNPTKPNSNSLGRGEGDGIVVNAKSIFKVTTLPFLNDGDSYPTLVSGNASHQVTASANLNLNKSWIVPEPRHILLNLVMRAK